MEDKLQWNWQVSKSLINKVVQVLKMNVIIVIELDTGLMNVENL